jgi:hypothetical protein
LKRATTIAGGDIRVNTGSTGSVSLEISKRSVSDKKKTMIGIWDAGDHRQQ